MASTTPHKATPWTLASIDDPLYLMSKVGQRGAKMLTAALEDLGLRPRHLAAMRFLAQNSGASQREIVDGLWSDSSSVVAMLDFFTTRGIAQRLPNPSDRRAYSVVLTDHGVGLLAEAEKASADITDQALEALDAEQREKFLELLKVIVDADPTQGIDLS